MKAETSKTYHLANDIIFTEFFVNDRTHSVVCSGTAYIPLVFQENLQILKQKFQQLRVANGAIYSGWLDVIESKDTLDSFIHSGLIKDDKAQSSKNNAKHKAVSLIFITNSGCNLSCVYCFEGKNTQTNSFIDLNTAISVIDTIFISLFAGDSLNINFMGGEPLLNWSFIEKIIVYIENKSNENNTNYSLLIQTNLTYLPNDFIFFSKEHNINFAINVDDEEITHNLLRPHRVKSQNSFKQTYQNLEALKAAGIKFDLRSTITAKNVRNLSNIAKLHMNFGANGSYFVLLVPNDVDGKTMTELLPRPDEYFQALNTFIKDEVWNSHSQKYMYLNAIQDAKNLTKNNCAAVSENNYVIDPSGHIYNCTHLVGIIEYNTGEINQLNSQKKESIASLLKRDNDHVCNACAYKYVCMACPITRTLYGDIDMELVYKVRELYCVETKTIINELLIRMAREIILENVPVDQKYDTAFIELAEEWRKWIIDSIRIGCESDSIVETMFKTGKFEHRYAQRIVQEAYRTLRR